MDILNKVGFYPEPAGLRPSTLPKPETVAPIARTENSTNPDTPKVQELPTESNSRVEMDNAIRSLNESVQNIQRGIEFSIDEESGRSVVKVVDRESGEVIRQLPSEDALAVSRQIKEFVESRQHAGTDTNNPSDEALGFIMRVQA